MPTLQLVSLNRDSYCAVFHLSAAGGFCKEATTLAGPTLPGLCQVPVLRSTIIPWEVFPVALPVLVQELLEATVQQNPPAINGPYS